MTYEQLEMSGLPSTESTEEQLRCCRRGFPASLTVLRERVRAMVTSVTCGERLQDVSARLNRAGSSVKIRPVCLPELIRDTSSEYLPTLPRWGIACHGEYGELATSERLISESGCSLWLTPTATDAMRSNFSLESLAKRWIKHPNGNLAEQVGYGGIPDANGYGVEQFGEQKEIEKVRRREDNKRRRAKENAIGRWWQTEPDVGRVVTRCPHRVDRLRGLGNMVVPAQIYPLFEVIAEIERGDENA